METDMRIANHDFDSEIADDILHILEQSDLSYPNAITHLCAVIAGICPDKRFVTKVLDHIYAEEEALEQEWAS